MVRHEAEEKFGEQLYQNKGAIVNQVQNLFDMGKIGGVLNMLSPENAIKGIVGGAAGKFTSALGLGNLGGFVGDLGIFGGNSGGSGGPTDITNLAGGLFGR